MPSITVSDSGLVNWSYTLPNNGEFVYSEVRWRENSDGRLDDWSGRSNRIFYSPDVSEFTIAGLAEGTRYKTRVIVGVRVDGRWRYLKSDTLVFTTPATLAPPSEVTIKRSDGALSVKWTPVSGASGYNIKCSDDRGDSWMCAQGVSAGDGASQMTTTIEEGIWNGQQYQASVQGYNSGGAGGFASSDFTQPYCTTRRWCGEQEVPQGTPAGVTGLTATRNNPGDAMTVSWAALSGALSYDVYCSRDGRQSWYACSGRVYSPNTSTTITNLFADDVYAVGVQAFTADGVTQWTYTAAASSTSPPARVVSVDIEPHASKVALDLSWSRASGATHYEYKVYCEALSSFATPTVKVRDQDTRTRGVEYDTVSADEPIAHEIGAYDRVCFGDVRAVNGNGKSAWTRSPVRAGPTAPQPAVTGVSVTRTSGQLAVSWEAIPHDHALDVILASFKYRVQCSSDDGVTWTACGTNETSGIDSTSVTITSSISDTTSQYKVRVGARGIVNTAPWGAWAESEGVALNAVTIPAAPSSLTVAWGTSNQGNALDLTWDSATGATYYEVYCSDLGGYIWKTCARNVTTNSATITGSADGSMSITAKRPYWIAVAAGNTAGLSPWKRSPGIWPVTIPHAISSVSATRSDMAIALTWTVPYDGSSPLTEYDIDYSVDGGVWVAYSHALNPGPETEGDAFMYNATSLENDKVYKFRVRPVNAAGDGPWTETASIAVWSG